MSKVCSNCGAVLEDNAAFCAGCGTASEVVEPAPAPVKSKKPLFVTIVAVIAALIVAGVVCLIIFGESCTTPIDRAIDLTFTGDWDDLEAAAPDAFWDEMDDTRDNAVANMKDNAKEFMEELTKQLADKFGSNYEVTYEVNDKNTLSNGKLAMIGKALEENFGIEADEVDGGYKLNITVSIKGSKSSATADAVLTSVEIDGDWYLVEHSGESINFAPTLDDVLEEILGDSDDEGYEEY